MKNSEAIRRPVCLLALLSYVSFTSLSGCAHAPHTKGSPPVTEEYIGTAVQLLLTDGSEIEGAVVEADSANITLLVDGILAEIPQRDVSRISVQVGTKERVGLTAAVVVVTGLILLYAYAAALAAGLSNAR